MNVCGRLPYYPHVIDIKLMKQDIRFADETLAYSTTVTAVALVEYQRDREALRALRSRDLINTINITSYVGYRAACGYIKPTITRSCSVVMMPPPSTPFGL